MVPLTGVASKKIPKSNTGTSFVVGIRASSVTGQSGGFIINKGSMAQRRMFSLKIVGSDAFLDMPFTSRELYFQMGMYADDDGFVSPRKIMRMTGAGEDDLKILIAKGFLIPFENGVVVVKHWKMNNELKKDRYTPSQYSEQKEALYVKENGAYTLDQSKGTPLCLQNVSNLDTQVSIGKVSIDKTTYGDLKNVFLSDDDHKKLIERYGRSAVHQIIGELSTYMASSGKRYKDHYATILNWAKRKGVAEIQPAPKPVEDVKFTPEEVAANLTRAAKVKEVLKR